mmetsp:Transcript_24522/g.56050  ORF Transcript_24522/g.56050 Transcript_24522/m.56050 type:complete len:368 (-) Transcript_24522:983-2086(-)
MTLMKTADVKYASRLTDPTRRKKISYLFIIWTIIIMSSLLYAAMTYNRLANGNDISESRKYARKNQDDDRRTRFLFVMGTEGSGHHLFLDLYGRSPAKTYLESIGLHPEKNLGPLLYSYRSEAAGLFSSAVTPGRKQENFPDGVALFDAVVAEMRAVGSAVRDARSTATPPASRWSVPVNCIEPDPKGTTLVTGMMSYPNFGAPSRAMQYPDLRSLYAACDEAGVACEHVFLHRDPHAVVRSTTMKRVFEIRKHFTMRVYDAMLSVMAVQLMQFPDRLAGCWDFDSGEGADVVGEALGWSESQEAGGEFRGVFDKVFKKQTKEMTEEERNRIVPPSVKVYMDTLMETYSFTVGICKKLQADQRQETF